MEEKDQPVKLISFIRQSTADGKTVRELKIGFLIEETETQYFFTTGVFEDGSYYIRDRVFKDDVENVTIEEAGYWNGQ